MHRTESVELTVLCLLRDGDRILLQNRVKNDWKGYTLPGGHVEAGESFVAAVKREMREETGLEIAAPYLCGIKQFPLSDGGRYLVILFRAEQFSGTLTSSKEGEMIWVSRSELSNLPTVADFAELLSVFDDLMLSEFQYTRNEAGGWDVHIF